MAFYLSGSHGDGTRVWVAPAGCNLVMPTAVSKLTIGGTGYEKGNSVEITWTAAPAIAPTSSIEGLYPYLTFVHPTTGEEVIAEVVDDFTATGAKVKLLEDIPAGAIGYYPAKLGGRSTVNLQSEDETAEIENFDNDGWKDYVMTALGQTVSTTGPYMAKDAGYMNALRARLDYQNGGSGKVALVVALPTPNFCAGATTYNSGLVMSGIATISSMPIESGAKAVIQGNIDFQFCGAVNVQYNGSSVTTPV